ncbi:hypothetical protein PG994_000026 [Apiospora phragmitis]|uniref:Uncharacterized protein n=1 Tax=Apiospora phragmitis TaxID=2905665 RepID=A0ABR1X546_9PEZI
MVPTTLFICLIGMVSHLLGSPVTPEAPGRAAAGLQTIPLGQNSTDPDQQGNVALLGDEGQVDWWQDIEKRVEAAGTKCHDCDVYIPFADSGCHKSFNQIDHEDFQHAINAMGLLNDDGEVVHQKSMRFLRYESVVIWVCTCAGKQNFPYIQWQFFMDRMGEQCPAFDEGYRARAGWLYIHDWAKGLNVDNWDSFDRRMKAGEDGCGLGCLW